MGSTKLERHDKEVSTSSRTVRMTLFRVIISSPPGGKQNIQMSPRFHIHFFQPMTILGCLPQQTQQLFAILITSALTFKKNLIAFRWNRASELTPRRISTISAICLQLLEDLHYNFTTGTAAKRGGPTLLAPGCARRLMTPKACRESVPKLKTCTDGWGKV